MDDLSKLLNTLTYIKDFNKICVGLASPKKIRSWSYGEIKTSDTLNYRTFNPENHGLFCAKTFGPIKNNECLCGKYKMFTRQSIVCEKCGVEVTLARVRRERMGHIELAIPIAHIWYFKSLPSRIGLLLDLSLHDLERIIYFEAYVVIEPGLTALKPKQILSESAYLEALEIYEHEFEARMGGDAIYELLSALDLVTLENNLHEQIEDTYSETQKKRLKKRLMLVQALLHSHTKPQWMVLTVLPVLPPDLRPLVPLENIGRFATSDLNNLYRRVINRNNRTKRLLELKVPEPVIRNELRLLQEAVDALLDNARRAPIAIIGKNKLPLQSLSDMIRGKQGRFRQNLLGKRVDYSGRSVIVVEPKLKWHQCGLPKEMALELFKPFLFNLMRKRGLAASTHRAKSLIEQRKPEIWKMLEQVVHEHPILLNRMPTLSRLNIQAFEVILIEGKAIQLHPLVAQTFYALFEGDQMAVHVPLTIEAQLESRVLMMSSHNILSPVNGEPLIVPSQEMILGLYFMTYQRAGADGEGMVFADINEVQRAYENGAVDLQASIQLSMNSHSKQNHPSQPSLSTEAHRERVKTTVGRAILSQCLPKELPFDLINRHLTKKHIFDLINTVFQYLSLKESLHFADRLILMALTYATRAGISLNLDDFIVAEQKTNLIDEAKTQIDDIQQKYLKDEITQNQRYYNIINTWAKTTDKITHAALNSLSQGVPAALSLSSKTQNGSKVKALKTRVPKNLLSMMIEAGMQSGKEIGQLTGMRGLIIKPNGSILETPILANFWEGLDTHQYFISTHSTRKNLVDTTIKIANAGYLTRRLVDVAQDVIITEADCGTQQGITLTASIKEGQIIKPLSTRLLGRVLAEDIFTHDEWIIKAGTLLDEKEIISIENKGIEQVKVRSPVTCQSQSGICTMCYGRDLATRKKVNVGEAVGVIAAQTIGESGIQLTIQTPDAKNIAKKMATMSLMEATNRVEFNQDKPNTRDLTSTLPRLTDLFEMRIPEGTAILARRSGIVRFIQSTQTKHRFSIIDKNGQYDDFSILKWQDIKVSEGQEVQLCDVIVEGNPNPYDILYLKGVNELVKHLINEIQEIYEFHAISINDKHLEVIIRQMLCTVTIIEPGDTAFLGGDIVTRTKLIQENKRVSKMDQNKIATWKPNLLGITKASLSTESFLSAASFMDTTRVLLNSAINNQCDKLYGIKENVIIGRLIPAGTGFENINTTDSSTTD